MSSNKTHSRQSGQALVESALILPLFIFILLGTLQMGLIYQARYLLKYATYRAVRAGALLHACKAPMLEAGLSIMAPVIGRGFPLGQGDGFDSTGASHIDQGDGYYLINDTLSYTAAFARAKALTTIGGAFGLDLLKVEICGPTTTHINASPSPTFKLGSEIDFDAPENVLWNNSGLGKGTLRQFERTKLRVQLKYYHQLIIPFANWILFKSWMGMNMMRELRMQTTYTIDLDDVPNVAPTAALSGDLGNGHRSSFGPGTMEKMALVGIATGMGRYFLPMHANYAFRMQSNFFPGKEGCEIPEKNYCWHYQSANGQDGDI